MTAIYLQVIGCVIFVMSTIALGVWLRRHPSKRVAEKTARMMHFSFLVFVLIPWVNGLTWLSYYDELLGIPSLPFRTVTGAIGALIMLMGLGFIFVSALVLLDRGEGLPAFVLTKKIVAKDIYRYTRNPLSLGIYLVWIALGLLTGSMFFTLWSLIALIPAHVLFLKYFEERELEIRFGPSYTEYKKKAPFLIPKVRRVSGDESVNNN